MKDLGGSHIAIWEMIWALDAKSYCDAGASHTIATTKFVTWLSVRLIGSTLSIASWESHAHWLDSFWVSSVSDSQQYEDFWESVSTTLQQQIGIAKRSDKKRPRMERTGFNFYEIRPMCSATNSVRQARFRFSKTFQYTLPDSWYSHERGKADPLNGIEKFPHVGSLLGTARGSGKVEFKKA